MTCGENLAAVCNFLDSINRLDELYITNSESDTSYLVSSILKHSSTLQTLNFHSPLEDIYGRVIAPIWPIEVLEQLQEQCTNLSHVEIDVSLVKNELTMKVFVEVPHAGNLLLGERNYCDSESRLPPLNVALVEVLASLPFKRIFEANPDASLKEPCSTRATRKGGKSGWNDSITRASDVFRN
ncbi:uncharacterized protein K441DRAFT_696896 [Cenococcum geophilum 1.58]|uniref:uncharacterized protein n=1 Tax=Cenococcum geophilum 1.58 TaxID=794803 RepID=UPI00358E3394|nr:hypothetical protein K441DRAFT_696896 [Cenococcum geophilum 1.58]